MKQNRHGFPVVVGVISTKTHAFSENLIAVIRDLFTELSERSRSPVLIIYPDGNVADKQIARVALEAGLESRPLGPASDDSIREPRSAINMEIAEMSSLVLLLSYGADGEASLHSYAQEIGRTILRVDAETGTLKDTLPQHLEAGAEWMTDLFAVAALSPEADLETIQARMDDVANRAAPLTRSWWRWLLLLQGMAVLVPLGWLVRRSIYIPVGWVAGVTFLVVLLLLGFSWWVRWRSMQKTWARARLVAELARSLLATADCPSMPGRRALAVVPALRPLRWVARKPPRSPSFRQWRDSYLEKRIDDQDKYFGGKQKQAEAQRKQLTRWATLLLDIALAFAFGGAVLSAARYSPIWLEKMNDVRVEIILGVIGVLMPVGLLLVQLLRGVQELNRRTARFAQQREMLKQARARLTNARSPALALEIIEDTEGQLLAEVLEWYFHAETAEHFVHIRKTVDTAASPKMAHKTEGSFIRQRALTILGKGGMAGLFILRVILGRVPWMVASGAAALIFIMYYHPNDVTTRAKLRPLAHLLASDGKDWNPDEERARQGCVIIVHGMYGRVDVKDPTNWPKECADAIEERMRKEGKGTPNICLVDWHEAAQPANLGPLRLNLTKDDLLENISAIRSQAHEVGDLLAFRLAKQIVEDRWTLREDRPFHLIGHSAGGFVVARAAILLKKLGFFKETKEELLRATILDTPAPDEELLVELPKLWPTDFCLSSGKVWSTPFRVPQLAGHWWWWPFSTPQFLLASGSREVAQPPDELLRVIERWPIPTATGTPFWDEFWNAHRSAYCWFIETIREPQSDPSEGFNRSPLLLGTP